jgi:hydrogenase-4 component E
VRRPLLFQAIGLLVAENGIYLLALSAPGGMPFVVDLGVLFDLLLVVTVAIGFTHRIHGEFGTGDTEHLRGLRD